MGTIRTGSSTHARATAGRASRAAAAALAGCLALSLLPLAGCATGSGTSPSGAASSSSQAASLGSDVDGELSSGAAVTVNGQEVTEGAVTDFVQSSRASHGLSDDAAWSSWLAENGMTGSAVRDAAIHEFSDSILLSEAVASYGISVGDDEVQAELDRQRSYYDGLGSGGWDQVRSQMLGYDSDDAYADHLAQQMLLGMLQDAVLADVTVSDDDVQTYLDGHAGQYAGKAGVYLILPDEATALQVRSLIESGSITAQEAALTYSLASRNAFAEDVAASVAASSDAADSASEDASGEAAGYAVASNAEDARAAVDATKADYYGGSDDTWSSALDGAGSTGWVGTDALSQASSSSETTAQAGGIATWALADLDPGQVSDPIQTAMGWQLIVCTGSYDPASDGTSLADLPSDLADQVRSDALEQARSDAWDAFGAQLYASASIDEAPMPAGLPYDVTPAGATASTAASSGTDAGGAAAGSASAGSAATRSATAGNASAVPADGKQAAVASAGAQGESAASSDASGAATRTPASVSAQSDEDITRVLNKGYSGSADQDGSTAAERMSSAWAELLASAGGSGTQG
ncbi:MAG: hypothetical protein SOI26_03200 [Coriobacteriales bacterium]|jgi:hypothetical protein